MWIIVTGAQQSADSAVTLVTANVDMSEIRNAQDCITASSNLELLAALEEVVSMWCKQIEQVFIPSEMIGHVS